MRLLKLWIPQRILYATFYAIFPSRKQRPMIEFIYKNLDKKLIGVEIGVYGGENAHRILHRLSIKRLYLIDPYLRFKQTSRVGNVIHNWSNDGFNNNSPNVVEFQAKKRLHKYNDEVIFIKKTSEDAVKEIPDDLDFVYIDGNHSYDYIYKDIELYYPKIKSGGVIGGHDFNAEYDVIRAVLDFADKHNLPIQSDGNGPDWWIVKEKL